jgi:hypothetical protein
MSRLKREEHAISLEVWDSRPYARWETDDLEPIRAAYADLSTKGFMTKIAKQWGGYLINRHAPPLGLDKIYAEIRPDEAVYVDGPEKHFHANRGIEVPLGRLARGPVPRLVEKRRGQ